MPGNGLAYDVAASRPSSKGGLKQILGSAAAITGTGMVLVGAKVVPTCSGRTPWSA